MKAIEWIVVKITSSYLLYNKMPSTQQVVVESFNDPALQLAECPGLGMLIWFVHNLRAHFYVQMWIIKN